MGERRSPRGLWGPFDVGLDFGTFFEIRAADILHVEEHVVVRECGNMSEAATRK